MAGFKVIVGTAKLDGDRDAAPKSGASFGNRSSNVGGSENMKFEAKGR